MDRLVLMVSAHRFSEEGRRRIEGQVGHLRRGDWGAMMRENAVMFRRPWRNAMVRARLWVKGRRVGEGLNDARAVARAYEGLFGEEFERNEALARRVLARTLMVAGTEEPFFDERTLLETAEMIEGARLRLFRGETHMVPLKCAREVRGIVGEFLGL